MIPPNKVKPGMLVTISSAMKGINYVPGWALELLDAVGAEPDEASPYIPCTYRLTNGSIGLVIRLSEDFTSRPYRICWDVLVGNKVYAVFEKHMREYKDFGE